MCYEYKYLNKILELIDSCCCCDFDLEISTTSDVNLDKLIVFEISSCKFRINQNTKANFINILDENYGDDFCSSFRFTVDNKIIAYSFDNFEDIMINGNFFDIIKLKKTLLDVTFHHEL